MSWEGTGYSGAEQGPGKLSPGCRDLPPPWQTSGQGCWLPPAQASIQMDTRGSSLQLPAGLFPINESINSFLASGWVSPSLKGAPSRFSPLLLPVLKGRCQTHPTCLQHLPLLPPKPWRRSVIADKVQHRQTWPESQKQSTDTNTAPPPTHALPQITTYTQAQPSHSSAPHPHLFYREPPPRRPATGIREGLLAPRGITSPLANGQGRAPLPKPGTARPGPAPTPGVSPAAGDWPGTSLAGKRSPSAFLQPGCRGAAAKIPKGSTGHR